MYVVVSYVLCFIMITVKVLFVIVLIYSPQMLSKVFRLYQQERSYLLLCLICKHTLPQSACLLKFPLLHRALGKHQFLTSEYK